VWHSAVQVFCGNLPTEPKASRLFDILWSGLSRQRSSSMRFAARLPLRRRVFHPPRMFASSSPRLGRNGLMVPKASDAGILARSPFLPRRPDKCAKLRHNHNQPQHQVPNLPPRHHHLPGPFDPKALLPSLDPTAGTTIFPSPGTWSTAGRNKLRVLLKSHARLAVRMHQKRPRNAYGAFSLSHALRH
jgi:hypothetical protein